MQCACAVLCHLWPVWLYRIFPHFLINGMIYRKNNLLNTKSVFWFSLRLLSETFLILRRTERDIITHVHGSSSYVLILSYFNLNWYVETDFRKILKCLFMESHLVGAELFRTDRQTDRQTLTVVFRNFAKAPLTVPCTTMNTAGCNGISEASGRSIFTIDPERFLSPCNHPLGFPYNLLYLHRLPHSYFSQFTLNISKVK
jgi:hypothetical protein